MDEALYKEATSRLGWDARRIVVARRFTERLLGMLRWQHGARRDLITLVFPRCRSVHTFGMRHALDIAFIDHAGHVLVLHQAVAPGRVVTCRRAAAVLERRTEG